jgi:hypothetical protein
MESGIEMGRFVVAGKLHPNVVASILKSAQGRQLNEPEETR